MPFTSGTFSPYTPGNPVVTGTTISSTAFNNTVNDIATGLSTALLKDGTQSVTANIPLNNFKLTGVALATTTGDALSYGRAAVVTTIRATAGYATVSDVTASTATATPVTLFSALISGRYDMIVYVADLGVATTSTATIASDGTNVKITASSLGANMSITLSGSNVQATQATGSNQVMAYAYSLIR